MITLTRKIICLVLISTSILATDIDDSEIINELDFFMAMEMIEDHSELIEEEESTEDSSTKDEVTNES
jgi:hypothetical protein